MRTHLAAVMVLIAAASANGMHGKKRCPLVGYGPANPFGATLTSELYTTNLAPTFLERQKIPPSPISSTDRQAPPVAPRRGSIPSIVLPPPAPIANPQLTPPPPPGTGGSTSGAPPAPTPASVKPSSSGAPAQGSNVPQSISPRRP